jgi:hypothetical protein
MVGKAFQKSTFDHFDGTYPALCGLARETAAYLCYIAKCLEDADSVDDFLAAMDVHARMWEHMEEIAGILGVSIPDRILCFSLAAPDRAHLGLSDYEVEALIRFDRFVSNVICEAYAA